MGQWIKPIQSQFQLLQGTTEYHYRIDLLRQTQRQHLAHQLFPLNDLIISPKLLVPPRIYEPGVWSSSEDITSSTIPFLIDMPELASAYNASTCTLAEALMGGANLVIVGQPGAGKTVALADFASQVSQKSTSVYGFHDHIVLFINVYDLCPLEKVIENPFQKIIEVITQNASRQIQKRLPKVIISRERERKVILLLDGLDELPEKYFDQALNIISKLVDENPNIQLVVTASHEYTGQLNRLGFIPIPLAAWSKADKYKFIQNWEKAWTTLLRENNQMLEVDTTLINSWFNLNQLDETPLELTLKLWAAYAGDVLGANPGSEILAYFLRLSKKEKRLIPAMEQLALQMVTAEEPLLCQKDVDNWVQDWKQNIKNISNPELKIANPPDMLDISSRVSKEFQDLIDTNIARSSYDNHIAFSHPLFTSYLTASAINKLTKTINIMDMPEWRKPIRWATRSLTFKFLAYYPQLDTAINHYLQLDDEIIHYNLLKIARYVSNLPSTSTWYAKTMRKLAGMMQNDEFSLGLRARVLLAMINTRDQGISKFLKGMLASEKATFRQLAALGCGLLQDSSAIEDLTRLLSDPAPGVHRSASLALVNIGTRAAIDAVAYLLLNGNELQRQAAAEAIANHPIESKAILEEGSEMEDLQVRRAVVYGLKRIQQPWTKGILQRLSIEDKEWVVKDAALHAIEALEQEDSKGILPLKPPADTPWLLAFAGERGIGISPGKTANDLLLLALKEGNEEQKLAALSYLKTQGNPIGLDQMIRLLKTSHGELKEAVFNTLWVLAMTGIELPSIPPIS